MSQQTEETPSSNPKQRSHWWPWLIVGAVLIGGSVTLLGPFGKQENTLQAAGDGAGDAQDAPQLPPQPVGVTTLETGTGGREISMLGRVVASDRATIRARTNGTVQQVLVDIGDRVAPGSVVARLDRADREVDLASARASLAEARSRLAELTAGTRVEVIDQRRAELAAARARETGARDNLVRTENLVAEGALAERSLIEVRATADEATSERTRQEALLAEAVAGPRAEEIAAQRGVVASAEATVARAQLDLERVDVIARVGGIVSAKLAQPGDTLEANDPTIELIGRDRLDIFLEIPEAFSGQVSAGQAVTLQARALPGWETTVPLAGIVPTAEAASRRQLVRARLENPPAELLPEMAIVGTLALPATEAEFVVSRDVLIRRGDLWVVYALNDAGQVDEVPIVLASDMGAEVAIASPELVPGSDLVIRGGDGLQDGASVQVFTP
ncbi:MAG: efflux RND transporter periplasmic adaptor subunit [Cyanobacteria bacterium J06641_5]